jgi:hypothetical protein
MTDLEKNIYNTFLQVTSIYRNKPFKLRKDFSKFEEEPNYIFIKKLSIFFNKHNIPLRQYFEAPYRIYNDAVYFDLAYYSSPRAIKAYTLYKNQLQHINPDQCVDSVKKSLEFITRFCIEKRIQLIDYITHSSGSIPDWVGHIKNGHIDIFSLMEFVGVFKKINSFTEEERELLLGKIGTEFLKYRDAYNHSKLLKPFLTKAFLKLQNLIFKRLQDL